MSFVFVAALYNTSTTYKNVCLPLCRAQGKDCEDVQLCNFIVPVYDMIGYKIGKVVKQETAALPNYHKHFHAGPVAFVTSEVLNCESEANCCVTQRDEPYQPSITFSKSKK